MSGAGFISKRRDSRLSPPRRRSEPPARALPLPSPTAALWFPTRFSWLANLMPKPCLGHKEQFGPPFDYSRTAQIGEEVGRTVEILHLHVDGTQLFERVSI